MLLEHKEKAMKISLDTRYTEAPQPNISGPLWEVTHSALMTACAIATRVSGSLSEKFFVADHVEVLRFRFRKQQENGTTLFKFATVITVGGQKYDREIESSLEMPKTSYSDNVNYATVNDLSDTISSFVREEIGKVIDAQRNGLESIKRRLSIA